MRVVLYPADEGGCGFYRLIWPGRALAAVGCDVHVSLPNRPDGEQTLPDELVVRGLYVNDEEGRPQLVQLLDKTLPFDVAVFQRPLTASRAALIRQMIDRGARVVIELDDDFTSVDPRNVAWRAAHPTLSPTSNYRVLTNVLGDVDLVTVSTPALARVYGRYTKRPPVVIPNFVPRDYLKVNRDVVARDGLPNGARTLGWSGSVATHPGDLEVVGGAVATCLRTYSDWQLVVVGTGKGVARRFGTYAGGEIFITGWVPLDDYPYRMAALDLGLVPLRLTAFNQGKSWLKGLEYASLGVPFVASPTQQYVELADEYQVGLLAQNPRVWQALISRLMSDEKEREDLGGCWRERVRARLVLEDNVERWWESWENALS